MTNRIDANIGSCSLFVSLPRNGNVAVELTSRVFDGADNDWLARRCASSEFDLCAAD